MLLLALVDCLDRSLVFVFPFEEKIQFHNLFNFKIGSSRSKFNY